MLEAASPSAVRPRNCRARITNRPSKMAIDGRTELGRRVRDLAEGFAIRLGGWPALSDEMAANVRKAAELTALAESQRHRALREGNVDPLALVRLEGASNRAVRMLGLDRRREQPRGPTLRDYLAEAADRHAADEAAS